MIVAETERLTIRHLSPDDAGAMRSVFGDAEVMRYGDGPQSDDWIRLWIGHMKRKYDERGYGLWAVTLLENSHVLGYCGLTWFPDINGRPEVEIGYRLARKYWGYGFATEAAVAVRDLAFSDFGLSRLIAIVDPDNVRSVRVAKKLGMSHYCDVVLEGYDHPDTVYACEQESADNNTAIECEQSG